MATAHTRRQPVAQPMMVVMQQPRPEGSFQPSSAFMSRGVKLWNGRRCSGYLIVIQVIIGFFIFNAGYVCCVVKPVGYKFGVPILVVGGVICISGCYMIYIAHKKFNALPPDHPDRIKYSQGTVVVPYGSCASPAYILPPATEDVSYSTLVAAPSADSSPQFAGKTIDCPPPYSGPGAPAPPPYLGQEDPTPSPSVTASPTPAPANLDPPPPYSEGVQCKNSI